MSINNKINITFLILGLLVCLVFAQNIHVTKINKDVIVLHPKDVYDINSVRQVGGNMTAICTDSGTIIIDSFISPSAGKEARKKIESQFPNFPIKYLINTHHHTDHIRGNQYFQDACIIAHINLLKHVSMPISLQIKTDLTISLGNKTFEILYFGNAHTDNDLVILDRKDRVLIMGDLLCYRKCNIMGSESSTQNWINLLKQLIARKDEYDFVIPGHGGVVLNVECLREQLIYLTELSDLVKVYQLKNLNLNEIKKDIVLDKYQDYMMFDKIENDIRACWNQYAN